MSNAGTYQSLGELATRLREIVQDIPVVLLFAYNRTGKTRLSMAFKDAGKQGEARDTLYFNAFTEDLFVWDNDLDGDSERHLVLNKRSRFFNALTELALDPTIDEYLKRYAEFDFDIDYTELRISFRKGDEESIKISRGEQNIFIWCLFMALAERLLDGHDSYQGYRYIFIDDPVSSLDDNNAISMACDLAKMLRRAAGRSDDHGQPAPIKVIISTHHALFFNVMCNELGRHIDDRSVVRHKRVFMQRRDDGPGFELKGIDGDVPFFQHIAVLADLQRAADPVTGRLYTFHFNALRSVMEKTSAFFGHSSLAFCLKALDNDDDRALFNRALQLLSHGPYSIEEPGEMSPDNQQLFRRMLGDFVERFNFALPAAPQAPALAEQVAA